MLMLTWPISEVFGLISNTISRKHEYEADAFAAKEGYGDDLIAALKNRTMGDEEQVRESYRLCHALLSIKPTL